MSGSAVQAAVIEPRVLLTYITARFSMTALSLSPARERAQALWRSHPREITAMGALAFAGAIALAGSAWSTPNLDKVSTARAEQMAPAPPPLLIRDIAPEDALAMNGKIPLASGPNPAAAPFSMNGMTSATRARALE